MRPFSRSSILRAITSVPTTISLGSVEFEGQVFFFRRSIHRQGLVPSQHESSSLPPEESIEEPLLPPQEPSPEACCGSGCEECVWTKYWRELRAYRAGMAKNRELGLVEPTMPPSLPELDHFEAFERRLMERQTNR